METPRGDVGLTAWQALVDTARVGNGTRVLITGAAGGIGHLAVQIAKARGAYVTAPASAADLDFVRCWAPTKRLPTTARIPRQGFGTRMSSWTSSAATTPAGP